LKKLEDYWKNEPGQARDFSLLCASLG